jgi:thioredoxin 1
MALEVTDQSIGQILSENEIVVLDFWAAWCGPCRVVGPIIDELAADYTDITIGKVNVDSNPESSQNYMITSIPTILFFRNGVEVDRVRGALPKQVLKSKIDEIKGL